MCCGNTSLCLGAKLSKSIITSRGGSGHHCSAVRGSTQGLGVPMGPESEEYYTQMPTQEAVPLEQPSALQHGTRFGHDAFITLIPQHSKSAYPSHRSLSRSPYHELHEVAARHCLIQTRGKAKRCLQKVLLFGSKSLWYEHIRALHPRTVPSAIMLDTSGDEYTNMSTPTYTSVLGTDIRRY
jgi:hypothetical protein